MFQVYSRDRGRELRFRTGRKSASESQKGKSVDECRFADGTKRDWNLITFSISVRPFPARSMGATGYNEIVANFSSSGGISLILVH